MIYVSFISLTKIIPVIKEVLDDKGDAVLLIKPQFEAGRELVEKKGVVRDETTQAKVVRTIIDSCLKDDFMIRGIDFSPIKGPAGNIEYLLYISKNKNYEGMNLENIDNYIKKLVKMSHDELDKED